MTETPLPVQLQPPGAGLPAFELFVARMGFRLMRPFISRAGASQRFRAEADRILALARSLNPADAARRVLIPRVRGMEDSSRYWSVYMTLEHLVIVDTGITRTIEALTAGVVPQGTASTAAVKPSTDANADTIDRFEATVRDYLSRIDALPDLRSQARFAHPWFGQLTALNWHRVAAIHHGIHRKQIERIVQLLPTQDH
jgi:hypothetical protein